MIMKNDLATLYNNIVIISEYIRYHSTVLFIVFIILC